MATTDSIDPRNLATDLSAVGLDEKSVSMYLNALREPGWSLEQEAARSGSSIEDARATRERLIEARLFEPSVEDPSSWIPASPRVSLSRLIDLEESRLWGEQQALAKARLTAQQFIDDVHGQVGETPQAVEIVEGLRQHCQPDQ